MEISAQIRAIDALELPPTHLKINWQQKCAIAVW